MHSDILFYGFSLMFFLIFVQNAFCQEDEGGFTIINKIRFPYNPYYDPFMGLIVAFSIKLVPSDISADLAWNIEANYVLPQNESTFSYPPIAGDDSNGRKFFDRKFIYKAIETQLDSFIKNYAGKDCFLRMICENSSYSTKETDILGDIFHIILSPTSSSNDKFPVSYLNAESYGKKYKHCKKYSKKCPVNVLDFFSILKEFTSN